MVVLYQNCYVLLYTILHTKCFLSDFIRDLKTPVLLTHTDFPSFSLGLGYHNSIKSTHTNKKCVFVIGPSSGNDV